MRAAVLVPTVDVRKRIPPEAIDDVVRQIFENFHPEKIFLFGSYAYDTPRPESDLDLLVIMDSAISEAEQAVQILSQVDYLFGLDLLVYTPEHFAQRLDWGDSFLHEVIERGVVLYESADH